MSSIQSNQNVRYFWMQIFFQKLRFADIET